MIKGQKLSLFVSILYICTYNTPTYAQLKSRFTIYRDPVKVKRLAKLRLELMNAVEKLNETNMDKIQRDVWYRFKR